jgi:hypothetical protein
MTYRTVLGSRTRIDTLTYTCKRTKSNQIKSTLLSLNRKFNERMSSDWLAVYYGEGESIGAVVD